MAKPVLSYPGAKWRFWKYIKPYIPTDIKDWREPFGGGFSMSLSIADDPDFNLERMIVGDLAPEIWAHWVGCRDNPDDVMEIAERWYKTWCPHHQEMRAYGLNFMKAYIEENKQIDQSNPDIVNGVAICNQAISEAKAFWDWAASVDTSTLSIPERAARTFLVNKFSFSGMGDSGTLSKERYFGFTLDKLDRIAAASPLLKKMEIKNVSFEETMADVDPNKTFIFLDPPYFKQESSGLYGKNGDTHKGFPHEHFAEFTLGVNCKWFITYDDSIKVRKMFTGKVPAYTDENGQKKVYVEPFVIDGGYTMAMKASEDALAGEELFIANYDIQSDSNNGLGDNGEYDF